MNDAGIGTLSDQDWDVLLTRIAKGNCTPFLGASVSAGFLPLGRDVAQRWAKQDGYPMADGDNLIKVAQFVALKTDPLTPKERIADLLTEAGYPDFTQPEEPHAVLARLPLPLYMTTNYDDFMYTALKAVRPKAQLFVNQWFSETSTPVDINATLEEPAVYHFHGHKDRLETMVLTEDDYLDFLVRISKDPTLIPPRIQQALVGTSLLFIGYSLADMNFRVVFRGWVESTKRSSRRISIAVQIAPDQPEVLSYLNAYFGSAGVRVFWGTARDFLAELNRRWSARHGS